MKVDEENTENHGVTVTLERYLIMKWAHLSMEVERD